MFPVAAAKHGVNEKGSRHFTADVGAGGSQRVLYETSIGFRVLNLNGEIHHRKSFIEIKKRFITFLRFLRIPNERKQKYFL